MAIGIATGITMAWLGFGYWSLVGMQVAGSAATCALVWAKCDWRPSAFKRRVGARPMLAFGGDLTAFSLLNYFTRNFDNILIGRVLGSSALGIYSKGYGLLQLPLSQISVAYGGSLASSFEPLTGQAFGIRQTVTARCRSDGSYYRAHRCFLVFSRSGHSFGSVRSPMVTSCCRFSALSACSGGRWNSNSPQLDLPIFRTNSEAIALRSDFGSSVCDRLFAWHKMGGEWRCSELQRDFSCCHLRVYLVTQLLAVRSSLLRSGSVFGRLAGPPALPE